MTVEELIIKLESCEPNAVVSIVIEEINLEVIQVSSIDNFSVELSS